MKFRFLFQMGITLESIKQFNRNDLSQLKKYQKLANSVKNLHSLMILYKY
ncbi:hypothetical protein TTHERM_000455499 (macronuclear) [Tetrahymena thermophila SB210]|uniref:Uncharacterized protein n=1 Tax=Tetrahymena thermophila (strain SB210) TaxID=312017 RepID=W7XGF3_TETTS|nr:hypothetical protein TTHERM_000455499 [Tetrahymena thermophila SB210]EWS71969.1 hypothetical protein TTHERM_000455499 [Tetrahymena thermophila SB210]|eukprot:XP_012655469.1 hypothetical protein TTHERM_000455499 [Tetrahymena thermophila SB210]